MMSTKERMALTTEPGRKICFDALNGSDWDKKDSKNRLEFKRNYTVRKVIDHGFSSQVYLEEYGPEQNEGRDYGFNTLLFAAILTPAECRPPLLHIRQAGHHWLDLYDHDGRWVDTVVAQWNPVDRQWYHSGEIAKCDASKLSMNYTKIVYNSYQPQPEPRFVRDADAGRVEE